MSTPVPSQSIQISLVECGAMLIFSTLALALPRLGAGGFARMESLFLPLARRRRTAVLVVGALAILLRLCLLPLFPAPLPFIPDDFSFLLQADTFLHGRLTNPTPALWEHFETIHVTMIPTYQSMYFPAQALLLALGKLLFGHPWAAMLLSGGLMCAAICWMLQAWMPPSWALLGGMIAILRIDLFSYWVNSYTGAATICATAGALVLGGLPRLMRRPRLRYALAIGLGAALLVISRPYEGLLLCLPTAAYLLWWMCKGRTRPRGWRLARLTALPLAVIFVAIGWLGYYDYRVFGKATTLPYTLNRAQYAVAPYYVWQPPNPAPAYRHEALRNFYAAPAEDSPLASGEMDEYKRIHSWRGFFPETFKKYLGGAIFFAGFALFPPLLMLRRVLLDRRIRFLTICLIVLLLGMTIEIYQVPHYLSPFTVVYYALGLQAMRHLRWARFDGAPAGLMIARMSIILCVLFAVARAASGPLQIHVQQWPGGCWSAFWYGPDRYGVERAAIASRLEQAPGRQLVFVTHSLRRSALEQWVYNEADLDRSRVIWARDMGPEKNAELLRHYNDRQPWLADLAVAPARVSPYAASLRPPAAP